MPLKQTVVRWREKFARNPRALLLRGVLPVVLLLLVGVGLARTLGTIAKKPPAPPPQGEQLPSVDVVLAREGGLRSEMEFTGTTRATREVTLRARTEGRLLRLEVDVGD